MNRSERGATQAMTNSSSITNNSISITNNSSSTTTNNNSSINNKASGGGGGVGAPHLSVRYKRLHHHHHYHHRRNARNSCWRNPCVIFLITFAAIGTLRFRVPARSRIAASHLILKQREKRAARKREHNSNSNSNLAVLVNAVIADSRSSSSKTEIMEKNSTSASEASFPPPVRYTLLEKGKNSSKNSFQKYGAVLHDQPLTVQRWAELMSQASNFNDPVMAGLVTTIRAVPYAAVFFETPPVTAASIQQQQSMEFVLVDAPHLHAAASEHADPHAFAPHFAAASSAHTKHSDDNPYTVAFDNLGGDARLIVPTPPFKMEKKKMEQFHESINQYAHLASFCRDAPEEQIAAVWRLAAQEYLQRITADPSSQQQQQQPVWFSTSGLGIYWLHFRLDSVPKYYTYQPYKQPRK